MELYFLFQGCTCHRRAVRATGTRAAWRAEESVKARKGKSLDTSCLPSAAGEGKQRRVLNYGPALEQPGTVSRKRA